MKEVSNQDPSQHAGSTLRNLAKGTLLAASLLVAACSNGAPQTEQVTHPSAAAKSEAVPRNTQELWANATRAVAENLAVKLMQQYDKHDARTAFYPFIKNKTVVDLDMNYDLGTTAEGDSGVYTLDARMLTDEHGNPDPKTIYELGVHQFVALEKPINGMYGYETYALTMQKNNDGIWVMAVNEIAGPKAPNNHFVLDPAKNEEDISVGIIRAVEEQANTVITNMQNRVPVGYAPPAMK